MFAFFAKLRHCLARRLEETDAKLRRLSLWQRGLAWLLAFAIIFGSGGIMFVVLGFAPISASAEHWAITDWFLHFAMRRGVQTRSLGTKVPPLDDPALVLKGAGHYATGCAPCHGAPGEKPPLIPQHITPEPPRLPVKIREWKNQELFWIVKHGVKFTAMPAWPALERDDEVWAMVAFLQQLPQLSAERYRELAYGPPTPQDAPLQGDLNSSGQAQSALSEYVGKGDLKALSDPMGPVLADCSRCHGNDGMGRGAGAFPILAGQSEQYLFATMLAYAEGERHSGVMQAVLDGMDERAVRVLAQHYAEMGELNSDYLRERTQSIEMPDAIGRGEKLAKNGIPKKGVPSCTDCHGPGASKRNPHYPDLAGQYSDYLFLQLSLFQSGKRGGSPYAHIMHTVAKRLTPEQMRDLSLYYGSLGASSPESDGSGRF